MRQFPSSCSLALCMALSVAPIGCAGSIEGGGVTGDEGGARGGTSGAPVSRPPGPDTGKPPIPEGTSSAGGTTPGNGKAVPGPMPLRRLSRTEYGNTVADLLRIERSAVPVSDLPADPSGAHGFAVPTPVGDVDLSRISDAADTAAALATKDLSRLMPCDPAKAEKECTRTFIESFGRKAFRRALTAAEATDLVALYDDARGPLGFDVASAIGQVVRAMLQSPQFLYRWELGPSPAKVTGEVVRLTPDELASRLSYFIWSSMPDDALFMAADSGRLATAEDAAREARRMLSDPRARSTIDELHRHWLRLKNQPMTELERAMDAETTKFAESIFERGGGLLDSLLLSPTSFVNKALADVYGQKGVTGAALVEQKLDEGQRFGVFTQASFLSATGDGAQSHPARRGKVLYEQLLCQVLPPQPDNVPAAPMIKATQSNRERFETIAQQPCASACHGLIHPLGFAFENYDGVGKYRTTDGGKPVDASGAIELGGQRRSFTSARDLMPVLAASSEVRGCVSTQWIRFALGRAEVPGEAAALSPARDAFARSNNDLRELVVAITQTPSFLSRTPSAMEVTTR